MIAAAMLTYLAAAMFVISYTGGHAHLVLNHISISVVSSSEDAHWSVMTTQVTYETSWLLSVA